MVLKEEKYLRITYDATYQYFHQKWNGFVKSEDFRAGIDFFYEELKAKKAHKVLIDVSEQQTPFKADMDYASQSISDFAAASGKRVRCAFVMPRSAILQVALRFFGKAIMGIKGVDMEFCKTEREAIDWIRKD